MDVAPLPPPVSAPSGAAPVPVLTAWPRSAQLATAFLAGVARSVAASNVTINFLLPGSFATDRLESNIKATAERRGVPVEQLRAERAAAVPAKRFGDPNEFGAACAFLCSAQAGYITGQNLLIDGGAFPGAF